MKLFRIVAFACACLGASVAMAAGTLPVGPAAGDTELSAFYRGPEAMPALPGVLLRSEGMPVQAQMPAAAQALRLLYSSTDERWHSGLVAVSGALYLPTGKPPPKAGRCWPGPTARWGSPTRARLPGRGCASVTQRISIAGWRMALLWS